VRGQVEAVLGQRETTTAVIAQSEHARARSRALRAETDRLRKERASLQSGATE